MPEINRNLCKELGCSACCRDMLFRNATFEDVALFPNAKIIDPGELIWDDGVFYKKMSDDSYNIQVNGRCPNLTNNNSCKIYGNRPEHCRNFEIESNDCKKLRKKFLRKRGNL